MGTQDQVTIKIAKRRLLSIAKKLGISNKELDALINHLAKMITKK